MQHTRIHQQLFQLIAISPWPALLVVQLLLVAINCCMPFILLWGVDFSSNSDLLHLATVHKEYLVTGEQPKLERARYVIRYVETIYDKTYDKLFANVSSILMVLSCIILGHILLQIFTTPK